MFPLCSNLSKLGAILWIPLQSYQLLCDRHVIELILAGCWRVSHNGPNCAIFGTAVQYSITSYPETALTWPCFFMLQSVRSWCVNAIMCISLQSYRLPQDCLKSRIQLQLSGLQILRSRLRDDCDNLKELILGIAGHWEDCWGPLSMCLGLSLSLGSDLTNSR